MALGATLGRLNTLADPGLLGAATLQNIGRASSGWMSASARVTSASRDERVDIDPDVITIFANVEASYEVTLD